MIQKVFLVASVLAAALPSPFSQASAKTSLAPVTVRTRHYSGVPYVEVSVPHARRTILYVHGGPDIPALEVSDALEGLLARRFRARVVKPVYYGSSERSYRNDSFDVTMTPTDAARLRRRLLAAANAARRGMPQAIVEIRRFLRHWDAPSTVVIGESFGAPLASLAARIPHRSRLVLIAPVLATQREIVRASIVGRYHPAEPIEEPRLVLDGRDRTNEVLDTPARRRELLEAISLSYYRPWQDTTLGKTLKRVPGRITVIVGLRDRIGMVTGREWRRLRIEAPPSVNICIDPMLGHEPPWRTAIAGRCFSRAIEQD